MELRVLSNCISSFYIGQCNVQWNIFLQDTMTLAAIFQSVDSTRLSCVVGCIENFFSSLSTNKGNRKLPFGMGFKNTEKFFKNVNVSCSHQRAEVIENRNFS